MSVISPSIDLASRTGTTVFHAPAWLEVLQETYGLRTQVVRARDHVRAGDDVPADDLTLYCEIDDVRGQRVIVLPFSDYCDPLVSTEDSWRVTAAALKALGAPVTIRLQRNAIPLADPGWQHVSDTCWHGADTTVDPQVRWESTGEDGIGSAARGKVRKAQRHGLVVRESRGADDIDRFHAMHRELRCGKYGMLAQPRAMFHHLAEQFGPAFTLLLVEDGGELIAGMVLLRWQDTWYWKFAASTDLRRNPNDLLLWTAIELAHHRGIRMIDFGRSDLDQPGLVTFKDKFATARHPLTTLRWTPPGHDDARGAETGRLLGDITRLLTSADVGDDARASAADLLYRYFA